MNQHVNIVRLRAVATALAELNEQVVFVGGATVGLYATDPAAPESRPTDDVDVVVEVVSYAEYGRIEERLRQLGFSNDVASGVICRYTINGLTVDVMPSDSVILGFSNRWYANGVAQSVQYALDNRLTIRLFTAPFFIASKMEAVKSHRHGTDLRLNSDFEDVVYLFDNRPQLADEIRQSPVELRSYLLTELTPLLSDPTVDENVSANLEPTAAGRRTQRILAIWQELVTGN